MVEHPTLLRRLLLICWLLPPLLAPLQLSQTHASPLRRTPMVRAVAAARDSVVNIQGKKTVQMYQDQLGAPATYRQVNGMGTGVVIDQRGYVLTNYHVVEGVREIQVTLADQRTVTATLVANDANTDLAIIKLNINEPLPVIPIGTSSDLMPAEPVVAVGNAYGYKNTVTQGIISELGRTVQVSDDQVYHNLIQTDASINPGNSGGPLLNIDGEMIGINVAVRVGAQGIGFAIPVDDALEVAARLLSAERKGRISHGVIGHTQIDEDGSRFVVRSVRKISPAASAGLQPGDVITAVDQQKIERALDFERAFLDRKVGDEVVLSVQRGDEQLKLNLVVGAVGSSQLVDTDPVWRTLGLRLEPMPLQQFRRINTQYRGGLKVVQVRDGGPAQQEGIRAGDILVGMHLWETISLDNVQYILSRPQLQQGQPFKFYILRGGETLYGYLQLSPGSRSSDDNSPVARKP